MFSHCQSFTILGRWGNITYYRLVLNWKEMKKGKTFIPPAIESVLWSGAVRRKKVKVATHNHWIAGRRDFFAYDSIAKIFTIAFQMLRMRGTHTWTERKEKMNQERLSCFFRFIRFILVLWSIKSSVDEMANSPAGLAMFKIEVFNWSRSNNIYVVKTN